MSAFVHVGGGEVVGAFNPDGSSDDLALNASLDRPGRAASY